VVGIIGIIIIMNHTNTPMEGMFIGIATKRTIPSLRQRRQAIMTLMRFMWLLLTMYFQ